MEDNARLARINRARQAKARIRDKERIIRACTSTMERQQCPPAQTKSLQRHIDKARAYLAVQRLFVCARCGDELAASDTHEHGGKRYCIDCSKP